MVRRTTFKASHTQCESTIATIMQMLETEYHFGKDIEGLNDDECKINRVTNATAKRSKKVKNK
jgi:hypothetical protein